jgi:hypothetical protein
MMTIIWQIISLEESSSLSTPPLSLIKLALILCEKDQTIQLWPVPLWLATAATVHCGTTVENSWKLPTF